MEDAAKAEKALARGEYGKWRPQSTVRINEN